VGGAIKDARHLVVELGEAVKLSPQTLLMGYKEGDEARKRRMLNEKFLAVPMVTVHCVDEEKWNQLMGARI